MKKFIISFLLLQQTAIARTPLMKPLHYRIISSREIFDSTRPIKSGEWLNNSEIVGALRAFNSHPALMNEARRIVGTEHGSDGLADFIQLLEMQRLSDIVDIVIKNKEKSNQ